MVLASSKVVPIQNLASGADRSVNVAQMRHEIRADFNKRFRALEARYDAAQNTPDNMRHWKNADGMSAEEAANPLVRKRLRDRSRYETQENNCHGKGIILKHAHSIVGRCPMPSIRSRGKDREWDDIVCSYFISWATEIGLGRKLRTMAIAKTVDGEAFCKMINRDKLESPVKLFLRLIEADQVATPDLMPGQPNYIDGIKFDSENEPLSYDVLKVHPGSMERHESPNQYDAVSADEIIHWFREDRPNQKRAVPETTPALPLFAMLRRFTLATIAAAETAADFAGVVRSSSTHLDETEDVDPLEEIDIEMRSLLTMPKGWDITQLKAEHPTTTYEMFERAILSQMAQCVGQPYNVAASDSSKHNFASGRLDYKGYEKWVGVERFDMIPIVLSKIFSAWYREFILWARTVNLHPYIPELHEIEVEWFFDETSHAGDPLRESKSEDIQLGNGSLTFAALFGGRGIDWRKAFQQRADELGITFEEYQELLREGFKARIGIKSESESDEPDDDKDDPDDEDDGDPESDDDSDADSQEDE